jgi:hypothetical protein
MTEQIPSAIAVILFISVVLIVFNENYRGRRQNRSAPPDRELLENYVDAAQIYTRFSHSDLAKDVEKQKEAYQKIGAMVQELSRRAPLLKQLLPLLNSELDYRDANKKGRCQIDILQTRQHTSLQTCTHCVCSHGAQVSLLKVPEHSSTSARTCRADEHRPNPVLTSSILTFPFQNGPAASASLVLALHTDRRHDHHCGNVTSVGKSSLGCRTTCRDRGDFPQIPKSAFVRLPTPVAAKAGSVPTHERLGPDDCENLQD